MKKRCLTHKEEYDNIFKVVGRQQNITLKKKNEKVLKNA
jgi:hypothetical protein